MKTLFVILSLSFGVAAPADGKRGGALTELSELFKISPNHAAKLLAQPQDVTEVGLADNRVAEIGIRDEAILQIFLRYPPDEIPERIAAWRKVAPPSAHAVLERMEVTWDQKIHNARREYLTDSAAEPTSPFSRAETLFRVDRPTAARILDSDLSDDIWIEILADRPSETHAELVAEWVEKAKGTDLAPYAERAAYVSGELRTDPEYQKKFEGFRKKPNVEVALTPPVPTPKQISGTTPAPVAAPDPSYNFTATHAVITAGVALSAAAVHLWGRWRKSQRHARCDARLRILNHRLQESGPDPDRKGGLDGNIDDIFERNEEGP